MDINLFPPTLMTPYIFLITETKDNYWRHSQIEETCTLIGQKLTTLDNDFFFSVVKFEYFRFIKVKSFCLYFIQL